MICNVIPTPAAFNAMRLILLCGMASLAHAAQQPDRIEVQGCCPSCRTPQGYPNAAGCTADEHATCPTCDSYNVPAMMCPECNKRVDSGLPGSRCNNERHAARSAPQICQALFHIPWNRQLCPGECGQRRGSPHQDVCRGNREHLVQKCPACGETRGSVSLMPCNYEDHGHCALCPQALGEGNNGVIITRLQNGICLNRHPTNRPARRGEERRRLNALVAMCRVFGASCLRLLRHLILLAFGVLCFVAVHSDYLFPLE